MKYPCIMADPPWRYNDRGTRASPDYSGKARETSHYDTMSLDDIKYMGDWIKQRAADNAHLWLWCTNSMLVGGEAPAVCRAWGFAPKQIITWRKPQMGMGYYCRNVTEHMILGVRGSLKPLVRNQINHFTASRSKHSQKPLEGYRLVERVSPGPRLYVFCRGELEGWDCIGDEADGTRFEVTT